MHGLNRVEGCHLHDVLTDAKGFANQKHCLFLTVTSCAIDAESKGKRASGSGHLHSAWGMKHWKDAMLENRPCPDINACVQ